MSYLLHLQELMPCEHCGLNFTELGKLNAHVKSKHDKEFKCVLCGLIFSANAALKSHIQEFHGDIVHCTVGYTGFF